jgi:hypothetical protein
MTQLSLWAHSRPLSAHPWAWGPDQHGLLQMGHLDPGFWPRTASRKHMGGQEVKACISSDPLCQGVAGSGSTPLRRPMLAEQLTLQQQQAQGPVTAAPPLDPSGLGVVKAPLASLLVTFSIFSSLIILP